MGEKPIAALAKAYRPLTDSRSASAYGEAIADAQVRSLDERFFFTFCVVLFGCFLFWVHPFICQKQRNRADHGDAGEYEPHRLRILCRLWVFIGIGDKALNEETDIDADNEFGHEPRQIGDANVSAHAFFGGDLRDMLQKTRLPHGFADSTDKDEDEEERRVGVKAKQECRQCHDGCSDNHHFVDVLFGCERSNDGGKQENDEGIEVAECLVVF